MTVGTVMGPLVSDIADSISLDTWSRNNLKIGHDRYFVPAGVAYAGPSSRAV